MSAALDTWFPRGTRQLFVDFMQQALYHPEVGYYTGSRVKLGREGDFVTAPELTPLFGHALARGCVPFLTQMENPHLIEFGAGTGRLCVDVLTQLEALGQLPVQYLILEVSGQLRALQEERVRQEIPHLAARVAWIDRWPDTPLNAVVLANEVLDAMPVHRFKQEEGQCYESVIVRAMTGELSETWQACENAHLQAYVDSRLRGNRATYVSEMNALLAGWVAGCYRMLNQGAMILIDYGFPAHEYFHPDRACGTLMCHHQHRAHPQPLMHVGEQDITAHVDFTHVAEAADEAGFHVAGYTHQAAFLLQLGILEEVLQLTPESAQWRAKQAIKTLTHPSEMGELFKVMVLTKAWEQPFGWARRDDKRGSL